MTSKRAKNQTNVEPNSKLDIDASISLSKPVSSLSEESLDNSGEKENLANDMSDLAVEISSDPNLVTETGGPKGPEPTRYGDWEQKGRCTNF